AIHPGARESDDARIPRGAGGHLRAQAAADPDAAPGRARPRARGCLPQRTDPRPHPAHPARRRADGPRDHVRELEPGGPRAGSAADAHPGRARQGRAGVAADAEPGGARQGRALVRGAGSARAARRFVIGTGIAVERSGIDLVIERAQGWFEREQYAEGYWWAELESNATMDAEYLLL